MAIAYKNAVRDCTYPFKGIYTRHLLSWLADAAYSEEDVAKYGNGMQVGELYRDEVWMMECLDTDRRQTITDCLNELLRAGVITRRRRPRRSTITAINLNWLLAHKRLEVTESVTSADEATFSVEDVPDVSGIEDEQQSCRQPEQVPVDPANNSLVRPTSRLGQYVATQNEASSTTWNGASSTTRSEASSQRETWREGYQGLQKVSRRLTDKPAHDNIALQVLLQAEAKPTPAPKPEPAPMEHTWKSGKEFGTCSCIVCGMDMVYWIRGGKKTSCRPIPAPFLQESQAEEEIPYE